MKSDVVIVGAGLAGLSSAVTVQRAGFHPLLIDGSERVGGRVKTDVENGYRFDVGFQVFNPAYPTAKALLNYDALRLRPFSPGVRIVRGAGDMLLGNPLRDISYLGALTSSIRKSGFSALSDIGKFGIYAGLAASKSAPDMFDCSAREALQRAGMSTEFIEHNLKPFLTGVFLEAELQTSRRNLDFVLEYFIKGTPAVPELGMAEIPQQLASLLHTDSILLNTWAHKISEHSVDSDAGKIEAAAVILASDFETAHAWLGTENLSWHSVTTWYHEVPELLLNGKAILSVDGDATGPVINSVPLTNAAPTYAPAGIHLVSSSTLGNDTSQEMHDHVLRHLSALYRIDTRDWKLVAVRSVAKALPSTFTPMTVHSSVPCLDGVFIAGDYLRQPSIEGAMSSGVAAGLAAIAKLRGR